MAPAERLWSLRLCNGSVYSASITWSTCGHTLHIHPVTQTFLCAHYLYAQTHAASEGRVKISNAAPAGSQFTEQDKAEKEGREWNAAITNYGPPNLLNLTLVRWSMLVYSLCSRPSAAADPAHTPSVTAQYQDNLRMCGTNCWWSGYVKSYGRCSYFWFMKQQVRPYIIDSYAGPRGCAMHNSPKCSLLFVTGNKMVINKMYHSLLIPAAIYYCLRHGIWNLFNVTKASVL